MNRSVRLSYPFVLYSDLYDHRQFVRALVNSSFSGLRWCPEVRDAKSEEDFLRRLQSVVFSPLAGDSRLAHAIHPISARCIRSLCVRWNTSIPCLGVGLAGSAGARENR